MKTMPMDPLHFYCVQIFLNNRVTPHIHIPLDHKMSSLEAYALAQEILTTGKGHWGDDPEYAVAFAFNPSDIAGVFIEWKVTYTRAQLDEHKKKAGHTDPSNPFAALMGGMN